jgi:hypothetical protein
MSVRKIGGASVVGLFGRIVLIHVEGAAAEREGETL